MENCFTGTPTGRVGLRGATVAIVDIAAVQTLGLGSHLTDRATRETLARHVEFGEGGDLRCA